MCIIRLILAGLSKFTRDTTGILSLTYSACLIQVSLLQNRLNRKYTKIYIVLNNFDQNNQSVLHFDLANVK